MYNIKLIQPAHINAIIPLLQLLDNTLTTEVLKPRLQKMLTNNYQCIGVYNQDELVAISGFWFIQKYYTGQYIEPDNVVIDSAYRGKGIGALMSNWLDDYANQHNCIASNLNVYTTNDKAIKFWTNNGYKIISFHLQKKY
jgi:diamine N-acetyltransferase